MNRIAIVTFHRAYNYGAVLQACALNRFLKDKAVLCDVLDYYPKYFHKMYHILPYRYFSANGNKTLVCHLLLFNVLSRRNRGFERFLRRNVSLSQNTYSSLNGVCLPYDAYIAGSDQIWNTAAAKFDPAFFLSMNLFSNKAKYSYAASFGLKKIPNELKDAYLKRLDDFRMISVREESGVSIVEELIGRSPEVVCDPTFLLDTKIWDDICGDKKIIDGDYIFLYYVKQPTEIREFAMQLAKDKHCKVVCLSCYFVENNRLKYNFLSGKEDRSCGFLSVNSASPDEFVNLIKHAKYVLTSSFHGTVFSALYHKSFLSQTIWNDGSSNERVVNLLNKLGLLNQSINSKFPNIDNEINWDIVDNAVNKLRQDGSNYLCAVLNDINTYLK